ncbi:MAG: HlyC/CorC family transporter [Kiritimatiellae bacterium]|nr:HlyC/CorC family transporter [Kiritimatiellia bacterium]
MSLVIIVECIGLVLLLAFSAFFSSAETALFSLNPIHIHRIGRTHAGGAARLRDLLARPASLLSTILIGNTIVNVAASSLGYVVAETLLPSRGEMVAIPAMTTLLLIFGEVAPKRFAMIRSEQLAVFYAPIFVVLIRVATPLRWMLEQMSALFHKQLREEGATLTEDEFRTVVEVGEEEGVLDEEERTMVDGIIRLEETQAKDVMTPRVDLVGIDLDDPAEEQEQVARGVRFRYIPVYRDSLDHAEGFLDVPRFILAENPSLSECIIPAFFVPETVPLDTLLATFQHEGRRVAFVADEYGGTAGLVTRGDILEEIADDAINEYGQEKPEIQKVEDDRWVVDGQASLEDINYELDRELEAEGADRIAGWVSAHLERMPHSGDTVEEQGCRVTVLKVRKRRVLEVELVRVDLPEPDEDEGDD